MGNARKIDSVEHFHNSKLQTEDEKTNSIAEIREKPPWILQRNGMQSLDSKLWTMNFECVENLNQKDDFESRRRLPQNTTERRHDDVMQR